MMSLKGFLLGNREARAKDPSKVGLLPLMLPMLLLGIGVFLLIALVLTAVHNRICSRLQKAATPHA